MSIVAENPQIDNTGDVIRISDPYLVYGFAQVPRPVLRAKGLSSTAKVVYALLVDYAWSDGQCFPGQRRMAEDLGFTEQTIRRALAELRDFGLIDWTQRGAMRTNVYSLLPLAGNHRLGLEHDDSAVPRDRTKMHGHDHTAVPPYDRTKMHPNVYSKNYTQEKDNQISKIRMAHRNNVIEAQPVPPTPLRPIPEPEPSPPRSSPAPEPPRPSTPPASSQRLLRLWQATIDGAALRDQLARDVARLDPISWQDGVVTLRAPAGDVARRCQRLAGVLGATLGSRAPVPLAAVVIVGPEAAQNGRGWAEQDNEVVSLGGGARVSPLAPAQRAERHRVTDLASAGPWQSSPSGNSGLRT